MGKTKSSLSFLLALIFVAAAAMAAYMLLHDLTGPTLAIDPNNTRIGPNQDIRLIMQDPSGVRAVTVMVKRNGQSMTVLTQTFPDKKTEREVTFNLKDAKLPEGAFDLEIKAHDFSYAGFGKGNSSTLSLPMRLDTTPPRIAVKTVPPNIKRGGSGLIVYTVSEEVSQTGVKVGDYFFQGRKQANGAYACLFPFPHTMSPDKYTPEIMARDLAGNTTSSRLLVNAQNRTFRADKMAIDDKFLTFKADELGAMCPEKTGLVERYVCVNTKQRLSDDAELLKMGQNSALSFLWTENTFQRLPRASTKANFGDFRSYYYGQLKIDEETHLGLDLASVAHAEVPAANTGKVLFAGRLGIYGNIVVIDHGLGLMTVYSHLNDISVAKDDNVTPGKIIGTTGTTGLAGGDHVHFGFLVGGIAVQPLEWLDPEWIKNNITNRLNITITQ